MFLKSRINSGRCLMVLLSVVMAVSGASARVEVGGLRTENLDNPLGLDVAAPRFSWQMSSDKKNVRQKAYRILVASSPELLEQDKGDLWDSGRVG